MAELAQQMETRAQDTAPDWEELEALSSRLHDALEQGLSRTVQIRSWARGGA